MKTYTIYYDIGFWGLSSTSAHYSITVEAVDDRDFTKKLFRNTIFSTSVKDIPLNHGFVIDYILVDGKKNAYGGSKGFNCLSRIYTEVSNRRPQKTYTR